MVEVKGLHLENVQTESIVFHTNWLELAHILNNILKKKNQPVAQFDVDDIFNGELILAW